MKIIAEHTQSGIIARAGINRNVTFFHVTWTLNLDETFLTEHVGKDIYFLKLVNSRGNETVKGMACDKII